MQTALRALLLSLGVAAGPALAADLTVSAAASLTNAFQALGKAYESQHPGSHVLFNFAASDALLQQIAKGAPVDVFASADEPTMDRAEAQHLLARGTRRDFASNTLVMIVPSDSKLRLAALADLKRAEVQRVAIGAPAGVPAGRYARGALETALLWTWVEPKAVYAQSVRQALDYVARGEVEAGFVYATDAAVMKDKVKPVLTVPTPGPIRYPLAIVAGSPNAEEARRFAELVVSPTGQALLARYGFSAP